MWNKGSQKLEQMNIFPRNIVHKSKN